MRDASRGKKGRLASKPAKGAPTSPAANEASSAGSKRSLAASKAAPAGNKAAPAGNKAAPAGNKAAPAGDEAFPSGNDASPASRAQRSPLLVPTVGVGASAGGLEAFSQLLEALPEKPGFAVVLIQHLAPQHESALPVLLSARTSLPVVHAEEGVRVEPNRIYVIPPNVHMCIKEGHLRLIPRPSDDTRHRPIDFFLGSLAEEAGAGAIGVILSGTASDGAAGLREIKAAGGMTFAQAPDTARFDGMPRAAIATGMVDLVLPPKEIALELVEVVRHPYVVERAQTPAPEEIARDIHIQRIFTLLRGATGVDFRNYKLPTIERRIQRRMALHRLTRIDQYVVFLERDAAELNRLYQDILINVTQFFREPASFEALSERVYPKILATRQADQAIRIWVAGCSTGEEAYSVAISLLEVMGDQASVTPIQLFATDLSEEAVQHARNGVYPEAIATDVSPERLHRFFVKMDGSYKVAKAVRDVCIFAKQDLSADPPFSKLDLILCRNVLIYLSSPLQDKLMNIFHYALKPHGFLMLGQAETTGSHSDLFSVEDKKHRIYAKKRMDEAHALSFPVDYATPAAAPPGRKLPSTAREEGKALQGELSRLLVDRYAPPGVIVDEDLQIVQFHGQTGAYLQHASGDPSLNILKMARDGLLYGLRSALQEASKSRAPARKEGVQFASDGGPKAVNIEIVPLVSMDKPHYLVLFEDADPKADKRPASKPGKGGARKSLKAEPPDPRLAQLTLDLAASREYLQSIIQELESANEELQSANEEILSSNEELQSTNEELDTAKEELQSTNEELNTLNEELHGRNDELSQVNSDLVNLLGSVQIAIVIIGGDLRIRRFTPMAEKVLNLIPGDVGRPIGHIMPNIDCPELESLIRKAIDDVTVQEREVHDRQGNWFSLRIRPYKSLENRIDGAVLALFDISAAKMHERQVTYARDFAEAVLETVRQPLLVLDPSLRVKMLNGAFASMFALSATDSQDRYLYDLAGGSLDQPALRHALEEALGTTERIEPREIEVDVPEAGKKKVRVEARRIAGTEAREPMILLALDTSDQPPASP